MLAVVCWRLFGVVLVLKVVEWLLVSGSGSVEVGVVVRVLFGREDVLSSSR